MNRNGSYRKPICRNLQEIRLGKAEAEARGIPFHPILVCQHDNLATREADLRVLVEQEIYCFDHFRKWAGCHRKELGLTEVNNITVLPLLVHVCGKIHNLYQLRKDPRICL